MQVISVERWTFWSAVIVAVVGAPLTTAFGTLSYASGGGGIWSLDVGLLLALVVWVLLLVSVAMGGSRDPSVRRIPAHTPP
jgi:hypothetical protein